MIKPLKIRTRICNRCDKAFKSTGKFSTICQNCNKIEIRKREKYIKHI
jgi:exosome complex RNA-binding protein Csl4